MAGSSLTEAFAVSLQNLVFLIIALICLGPVVDLFVELAATLELSQPWAQEAMTQMMLFGNWFYYIIVVIGIVYVVYPIIYAIKRHRYMDVEPTQEEQSIMGQ